MHTLVLGIGNTLLTDEGVGVHAVNYLREHYADLTDALYFDGGTLSFTLATPLQEADRFIVIDATQLDAEPGTVQTFVGADMDRFLDRKKSSSVHEVGLMDLLSMVRLVGKLPQDRALIGIQPKTIDWGEMPSKEVSAAIPRVARKTAELIRKWQT